MRPKYRIKEVYYKNGDVYYFPQKKSFLFWHTIDSSDLCWSRTLYLDGSTSVRREAERVIEVEKRREESDKVIKTLYTYYDESND